MGEVSMGLYAKSEERVELTDALIEQLVQDTNEVIKSSAAKIDKVMRTPESPVGIAGEGASSVFDGLSADKIQEGLESLKNGQPIDDTMFHQIIAFLQGDEMRQYKAGEVSRQMSELRRGDIGMRMGEMDEEIAELQHPKISDVVNTLNKMQQKNKHNALKQRLKGKGTEMPPFSPKKKTKQSPKTANTFPLNVVIEGTETIFTRTGRDGTVMTAFSAGEDQQVIDNHAYMGENDYMGVVIREGGTGKIRYIELGTDGTTFTYDVPDTGSVRGIQNGYLFLHPKRLSPEFIEDDSVKLTVHKICNGEVVLDNITELNIGSVREDEAQNWTKVYAETERRFISAKTGNQRILKKGDPLFKGTINNGQIVKSNRTLQDSLKILLKGVIGIRHRPTPITFDLSTLHQD